MPLNTLGNSSRAREFWRADMHHAVGPSIVTAHRLMHDEWRSQLVRETELSHAISARSQSSDCATRLHLRAVLLPKIALLIRTLAARRRLSVVGAEGRV
jgi:hypothetical protein